MRECSRRVLVIACSRRKRSDANHLPAIDRYDGPLFRIVRRYLRESPEPSLGINVISAEHGLIPAEHSIADYERVMTAERAEDLRAAVLQRLSESVRDADELFLCAGRKYLVALDGYNGVVSDDVAVGVTTGSIGKQSSDLWRWLRQSDARPSLPASLQQRATATIRGINLRLTRQEILEIARCQKETDGQGAQSYQTWAVVVGDDRVAPKWLVSQLSGLPVSAFRTADACRVLEQLGIEIRRA